MELRFKKSGLLTAFTAPTVVRTEHTRISIQWIVFFPTTSRSATIQRNRSIDGVGQIITCAYNVHNMLCLLGGVKVFSQSILACFDWSVSWTQVKSHGILLSCFDLAIRVYWKTPSHSCDSTGNSFSIKNSHSFTQAWSSFTSSGILSISPIPIGICSFYKRFLLSWRAMNGRSVG